MKESITVYRYFFFQAEDGIRDLIVTGVQTCALPIWAVHPSIIVLRAAVRQGPDGLRGRTFRTYQRPREKKPRSARTTITITMIQRMLTKIGRASCRERV